MTKIPVFSPKVTKLSLNSAKSKSLKTTIPEELVRILKLKEGGEVIWRLYMDANGNAAAYFSTPENFDKLNWSSLNTLDNAMKKFEAMMNKHDEDLVTNLKTAVKQVEPIENALTQLEDVSDNHYKNRKKPKAEKKTGNASKAAH